MKTLPPDAMGRHFEGVLYIDHFGRPVVADAEGTGRYRVVAGNPIAIEVDGAPTELRAGQFNSSLVVTGDPGVNTAVVQGTAVGWPVGEATTVALPHRGAGWVLRCQSRVLIDGKRTADRSFSGAALPFFSDVVGEGDAQIVACDGPGMALIDKFGIEDGPALKARSFEVQNMSDVSRLDSTFNTGEPLEAPIASHLNRASWLLDVPPNTIGLRVRKTYDRFHGRQRARVLIDGEFAGWWYEPDQDRVHRWGECEFGIPEHFIAGKERVRIAIDPPPGTPLWSVGRIQTFAMVAG